MDTIDTIAVLQVALFVLVLLVSFTPAFLRQRRYIIHPGLGADSSLSEKAEQRRQRLGLEAERRPGEWMVETPSGFVSLGRLSEDELIAQRVTWKWQRESDHFLALGRVADTLFHLESRTKDPSPLFESVSLERIRRSGMEDARLCVVVRSRHPRAVAAALRTYGTWLGNGLVVERAWSRFEETGQCVASRNKGSVGGYLRDDARSLGMTCSHVLGAACQSSAYRTILQERTQGPDVALVRPNPCFRPSGTLAPCVPRTVGDDDVDGSIRVRMHPHHRVEGRINAITLCASYAKRRHYFPHMQVAPNPRLVLDLIPWPPWGMHFSQKGDSGSWAMDGDTGEWLGLVVAGNRFNRLSYAALPRPLLDFLAGRAGLGGAFVCLVEGG